jgi:hypothetical protein
MTEAVTFRHVGRPKQETRLATPEDVTRVPARISKGLHEKLRELCLIRLRRPIEAVIGEWVEERLLQELRTPPPRKK